VREPLALPADREKEVIAGREHVPAFAFAIGRPPAGVDAGVHQVRDEVHV
jgi:hypothetical protein